MVYIALGSNQGNRFNYIQQAVYRINSEIGIVKSVSKVYETLAQGFKGEAFLNACIGVETTSLPLEVLVSLHNIENEFGRKRSSKNRYTARTLDLDIILYKNEVIDYSELKIPHPQMELRQFVLTPLVEIADNVINPKNGKSIEQIQKECENNTVIKEWQESLKR